MSSLLATPAAHGLLVGLVQEVKLRGCEAHIQASVSCFHLGWTYYGSGSLVSDIGNQIAGTALLLRHSVGSQALCDEPLSCCSHRQVDKPGYLAIVVVKGRVSAIKIDALGQGGVVCVSLYLKDGIGLVGEIGEPFLSLLSFCFGVPFVIGGDWNGDPEVLLESGFCGLVRGKLFAADGATFVTAKAESKLDFFVVSNLIQNNASIPVILKGSCISPHRVVGVKVNGNYRAQMVRVPKKPKRFPLASRKDLEGKHSLSKAKKWHCPLTPLDALAPHLVGLEPASGAEDLAPPLLPPVSALPDPGVLGVSPAAVYKGELQKVKVLEARGKVVVVRNIDELDSVFVVFTIF